MSDFVSGVKLIPYPQEAVYAKLSDLSNLEALRTRLDDPAIQEKIKEATDKYNAGDIRSRLDQMVFERDTITVNQPPVGNICLRIIEREEPKTIKFQGEGTPIAINVWIQLLPHGEGACKMRITLRAELNMFIKAMASKPLQEAVNKMADMLAMIPYNQ